MPLKLIFREFPKIKSFPKKLDTVDLTEISENFSLFNVEFDNVLNITAVTENHLDFKELI